MFPIIAADCSRLAFVESLSLGHGETHVVNRASVFDDVIMLYTTQLQKILLEYPFRTAFAGEKAIDFGGVTRDVFSAFLRKPISVFSTVRPCSLQPIPPMWKCHLWPLLEP